MILQEQAKESVSYGIRVKWDELLTKELPVKMKIAVLSTFTVDSIIPYLGVPLEKQGLYPEIWIGPYNQIIQEILTDESRTSQYEPDTVIVWPRFDDNWGNRRLPYDEELTQFLDEYMVLANASAKMSEEWNTQLIFVLPELPYVRPAGLGDASNRRGITSTSHRIREKLRDILGNKRNIIIFDAEEIVRKIGVSQCYDFRLYSMAKIPYTEDFFMEAGFGISALISAAISKKPKMIVFDADNILWEGRVTKEHAQDIDLAMNSDGADYLFFQAYLSELKRQGVELSICTKNNETNLKAIFLREEMRIHWEDIDNWIFESSDIVQSVKHIIKESGSQSGDLIFLDYNGDYGFKTLNVLPDITYINLSSEVVEWIPLLQQHNILNQYPAYPFTEKSGDIPENENKNDNLSLENFLRNMGLEVEIFPMKEQHNGAVIHLTESVGDFNTKPEEYTKESLKAYVAIPQNNCLCIKVRDRFGDYGISGALFYVIENRKMIIESYLLNCRILGRDVEKYIARKIGNIARENNCSQIEFTYKKSERNQIAGDYINSFKEKADIITPHKDGFSLTIDTIAFIDMNSVRSDSTDTPAATPKHEPTGTDDQIQKKYVTFNLQEFIESRYKLLDDDDKMKLINNFTTKYTSGKKLTKIMRMHNIKKRLTNEVIYVEPRTEVEIKLTTIWKELLHIEKIGVHDNFFNIGGNSILATQLLFHFYKAFNLELPIRIFFENPTIATMASTIEAIKQVGNLEKLDANAVSTFHYLTDMMLKKDIILDDDIRIDNKKLLPIAEIPKKIFFTGATGFVGAFILAELLEQTDATLYCLVRTKTIEGTQEEALQRIKENLQKYFLWKETYPDRIIHVTGDLGLPKFGLDQKEYDMLSRDIDTIYHCGAITNYVSPYSQLTPVNVQGTKEILRFSCTKKLKPVNYTSTLYIYTAQDDDLITEETVSEATDAMITGYQQTKWVSDRIMLEAQRAKLPVSIYRLGRISGHSKTGACQTNDLMWAIIRAGVEADYAFEEEDITVDMVPVDYISKSIVYLSTKKEGIGKNYHLFNDYRITTKMVFNWMRNFGYKSKSLPFTQWRERLFDIVNKTGNERIRPIITFLPDNIARWRIDIDIDNHVTREALHYNFEDIMQIDEKVFHQYLHFFIKSGYMKSP